jgi:TolB-like protein
MLTRAVAIAITAGALTFVTGQKAGATTGVRVAVMEFTPATADPSLAPLGKGLQSMVTTDLANVRSLTVVERERLKDIQSELKLSHGKSFDPATAAKIGKLAGASHLFVGSYTVVGETMRLDGRLIAVDSGEVLVAEQIAGEKALFFELEQKLVQKVIALLGIKLAPKEKAALARPHTADFQAFQKFSEGIEAFDDGRLEEATRALNEATAIDKDFKLASLTLEEYERLAAQVRAKASAAGRVEGELRRLEKNKAIAAEVAVLRKLWPLVDLKGPSPEVKLKRVAAACVLVNHYRSELGFHSRGPVSSEDLAAAGFDEFSLARTADALFARAWSEAPDLFPRTPPLCFGFGMISSESKKDIGTLLGYEIEGAAKLAADTQALLSYMANNAFVGPAARALQLDPPGEVRLWERLYALAQRLPRLGDEEREHYEASIAQLRRRAGDFDGSTQLFAAASRHTKDSYRLQEYAEEIEKNGRLKQLLGPGAPPRLRERFLLRPDTHESDLQRLSKPGSQKELVGSVDTARDISENERVLFGGLPAWRVVGPSLGVAVHSGPRSSLLRTDELRYEGWKSFKAPPSEPVVFATSLRGRRLAIRASIDQSAPPADWRPEVEPRPEGGAEVGVAFAINRIGPEGGIKPGAPAITVGYAVLVANDRARLVRILRDGEHRIDLKPLAEAGVDARAGRRLLEVKVEPGTVSVTVDGKQSAFPWKPEGDGDGFAGFIFNGLGYAAISQASASSR